MLSDCPVQKRFFYFLKTDPIASINHEWQLEMEGGERERRGKEWRGEEREEKRRRKRRERGEWRKRREEREKKRKERRGEREWGEREMAEV